MLWTHEAPPIAESTTDFDHCDDSYRQQENRKLQISQSDCKISRDCGMIVNLKVCTKLNQRDAEGEVSPYFVRINFFFTARVYLKESNGVNVLRIHHLANVDWFHFANKDHAIDKLSGLPVLQSTFYKRENIGNVRRLIRRVALLEVKKKLSAGVNFYM